ncbi:MAG: hypothetical protein JWP89_2536 [Schlesneria sp.]|nr:hypothetical protein [Schlesneria sp.]
MDCDEFASMRIKNGGQIHREIRSQFLSQQVYFLRGVQ